MSLGQTDGSGIGECVNWVLDEISGGQDAQRCRNQTFWLIHTKRLTLKDEICC